METREIPANVFNEQVILANMIHSIDVRKTVVADAEIVDSSFLAQRHQIIYLVFKELVEKGLEFNEDTFINEAKGIDFGGVEYLQKIEDAFEINQNIDHHISILKRDKLKKDLLVKAIPALERKILDENSDIMEIYGEAGKLLDSLEGNTEQGKLVITGDDLDVEYRKFLKDRSEKEFKGFHFSELDAKLTCGLEAGQISLIAALSGQGKSTFCANVASRLAHHGTRTLFCALEEGGMRVLDKIVGSIAKVKTTDIKRNYKTLDKQSKYRILEAIKGVSQIPLMVYNKPDLNFSMLRMLVEKYKPEVIIIDLFEKMTEVRSNIDQKNISENLDVLQLFVQKYNIHACITAQISREKAHEKTKNKRPTLDSIKNSGKYFEIADLVIGLFRPAYFFKEEESKEGEAEVIPIGPDEIEFSILKQRDGPAPLKVVYNFVKEYNYIGDYEEYKGGIKKF